MDENKTQWNTIAAEYDEKIVRGDFFREKLLDPAMLRACGPIKNLYILDAGCGQGYFSHILHMQGARVCGIDVSENLIKIARDRYAKNDEIEFRAHDLRETLPFEDKTFDCIVSHMTLMDFDPISLAISEWKRILRPSGKVIISILHPIFTSGEPGKSVKEYLANRLPHFRVRDYIHARAMQWTIADTTHKTTVFHRSLETYAHIFREAGFVIKDMYEPTFETHDVKDKDNFLKMLSSIPTFLIVELIVHKDN